MSRVAKLGRLRSPITGTLISPEEESEGRGSHPSLRSSHGARSLSDSNALNLDQILASHNYDIGKVRAHFDSDKSFRYEIAYAEIPDALRKARDTLTEIYPMSELGIVLYVEVIVRDLGARGFLKKNTDMQNFRTLMYVAIREYLVADRGYDNKTHPNLATYESKLETKATKRLAKYMPILDEAQRQIKRRDSGAQQDSNGGRSVALNLLWCSIYNLKESTKDKP
ncbi:TPA: hypothetical protein HA246_05020 [Candidatus Woesearchaeota archaeon]|nr:hypothetical protein [Candidatus Woesearchaeota archaeon]